LGVEEDKEVGEGDSDVSTALVVVLDVVGCCFVVVVVVGVVVVD